MPEAQQPRLAADQSISATFMRAMLAPLVPLTLLVIGLLAGVGTWVFFALVVLLLAVAGLAMITALSPGLAVFGNRLEVSRPCTTGSVGWSTSRP
jgi:preprotein translocase subunit SecF